MRVDFDDVRPSLTPVDTLGESSWPVDGKIIRNDQGNDLATREEDEFSSDSDRRWAEAYWAAKMDHLWYGIPSWRENRIFTVGSL
jgi:hypothetical protein